MASLFDAIIIGTGQAGPSLAARLSEAGLRVAIIERNRFGGTCVNTGCTPTKTLIASAYVAQTARRASSYGVSVGAVAIDMKAVKARKDAISARSSLGIERWLRGLKNVTVFGGTAQFGSPDTVRVNSETLRAAKIFINVGGRAFVPPFPGIDRIAYFTNSSMMAVDFVPGHLIVVGGSYVGLEFAQMFRRFGSEVTVVEQRARLISREDEDVSDAIREILVNEGINVRTEATCIRVDRSDDGITAGVDCRQGEPKVMGTHLLLAVGRIPNTDDLGLERAAVAVDSHGYIQVDEQCRTNVPGIWALGDCNGQGAFTHTSYNDFEIVAANLLDGDPRKLSDRIPCYALFTDPPLGRVGMTAAEVEKSGRKSLTGKMAMSGVNRAVERGETQGFIKVIVDANTHEILGAAILGLNGDEVVHSLLDVMYARAPYTAVSRAVHIHPTVSELIPTLLGKLRATVPERANINAGIS
jgi:pyruvate/2-oxoglutarate dehydrogenase complex dihydrolipoamide dehydrogenase (E3) component